MLTLSGRQLRPGHGMFEMNLVWIGLTFVWQGSRADSQGQGAGAANRVRYCRQESSDRGYYVPVYQMRADGGCDRGGQQ